MAVRDAADALYDNARSFAKSPGTHLRERTLPALVSAMTDGGHVGQAKVTLAGRSGQLDAAEREASGIGHNVGPSMTDARRRQINSGN